MSAQATVFGVPIAHSGPAPYRARPASDRDPEWPLWFVADATGLNGFFVAGAKPTPKLMNKELAMAAAEALNASTPPPRNMKEGDGR